ncbi:hypothetical protein [Paenibacillus sp. J2TS4]|uniref:hypothetical protein n=1 Tax=Paenibacillus sp. J2TS4 TaxID=2807194 RepID=UPI001BCE2626|nr:hypothetical protein [Paenibacillus sp. J2TS4]
MNYREGGHPELLITAAIGKLYPNSCTFAPPFRIYSFGKGMVLCGISFSRKSSKPCKPIPGSFETGRR